MRKKGHLRCDAAMILTTDSITWFRDRLDLDSVCSHNESLVFKDLLKLKNAIVEPIFNCWKRENQSNSNWFQMIF
jgi:hypothetical protein